MLKALVFDLDNTLYDYDSINEKAIEYTGRWLCKETGISYGEFHGAFLQSRELTKRDMRDCASRHNRMIYFQKMSECLGFNPFKYSLELYEKYWGYMLGNMQLESGVDRLFERLKHSGIKIGICTDLTTHIQHRKIRKLQIGNYVNAFVSSEEADAEKPDIKIFRMIISKLGIRPEEALYIGDSYEKDVIGAKNAGLFPVWFNPHGKSWKGEVVEEMLEIAEMGQLERYIYERKQPE